jgi:DNA-binding transcriptional LysR family regulator
MLPLVDFEKLRTFYVSTKTGKFSAAAQELGMDSSSITRQIQGLERDLNCILFERNGFRGLRLTEKGKILESIAHKLFAAAAEIEPALSKADNDLEGNLKVWVHGGYSFNFVSAYIDEFMKTNPQICLEIITSSDVMDVSIREADIAIGPNIESNNDLIEKKLFTYNLKLYASRNYLEAHGTPKNIEDLKEHRFVSASSPSLKFSSKVNWYLELIPDIILDPYFVSNSRIMIEKIIKMGFGIGSKSPQFIDKNDPDLLEVLPEVSGPEISVSMAYGEHFKNSKKVDALFDFFKGKACLFFKD